MKYTLLNAATAAIFFLLPALCFSQSGYVLFTAAGNINNSGTTNVTGDIGTFVGAINGFPPGIISGQTHVADASSTQAASDVATAYANLSAMTCGSVISAGLGSGQTLTPNVYCINAASTLDGALILDAQGDAGATFIFKINGAFTTGVGSTITLLNSALCTHVIFQVSGAVSLGQASSFKGTIISGGAISILESASVTGKVYTTAGAINLSNNAVALGMAPSASTISANGATTFCDGTSLMLFGNNNGGVWSTGATTSTITVIGSGDYFVTNSNDCGTINSNHIVTTVVNAVTVSTSGSNLISKTGNFTMTANTPASGETGTWSIVTTTSTTTPVINDINSPTTTVTGLSNLKTATLRWTITNGTCATTSDLILRTDYALSVELLQFTAQKQNQIVLLNWITASEKDNGKFIIERSSDGIIFSPIGEIKGAGNSFTENKYAFIDKTPNNGINYYRLRTVDFSGQFTLSNIISIDFLSKKAVIIYPNPVTDILNINLTTDTEGKISYDVINNAGQSVIFKSLVLKSGSNLLDLNLSNLPSGIYYLRFEEKFDVAPIRFTKN